MNQLNKTLTIALIIQLAIGVLVFWSQRAVTASVSGPLFTNFKAGEVTTLTLKDGDKNEVVLAKKDDAWFLSNAGDYPADGTKILPILEKVEKIKTNRLVTKTDASHKRLQVSDSDFNRLLEFKLKDGSSHKLYLGSSGGAGATYIRTDAPEVYMTSDLSAFEVNAQPSNWIDTLYFSVPQTATTAVTLQNPNGTFEFKQTSSISWTMKGLTESEPFNNGAFTGLLNQIISLNMLKPLGKEKQSAYGLDKPQATIKIQADKEYAIDIGAKDPKDETYVVKASNSPYYVRIAKFAGDNFTQKSRTDFIQQPPPQQEGEGQPPSPIQ